MKWKRPRMKFYEAVERAEALGARVAEPGADD